MNKTRSFFNKYRKNICVTTSCGKYSFLHCYQNQNSARQPAGSIFKLKFLMFYDEENPHQKFSQFAFWVVGTICINVPV